MGLLECTEELESRIANIKPSEDACRTPPAESWFDASDLEVDCSETKIKDMVESAKSFQFIREAASHLSDMLHDDSDALLRKSATIITKASRG
jgi:hypothetical protein